MDERTEVTLELTQSNGKPITIVMEMPTQAARKLQHFAEHPLGKRLLSALLTRSIRKAQKTEKAQKGKQHAR